MKSRALKLERRLKDKSCIKCGQARLVQRRPRVYNEVRCQGCGGIFTYRKGK